MAGVPWRQVGGGMPVVEPPAVSFAGLLRRLRIDAGLTQEQLAEAAGLSYRSISDLERGINLTPRKETVRLLADALNLVGGDRTAFEATARWRGPASGFIAPAVPSAGVAAGRGPCRAILHRSQVGNLSSAT